MAALASPQVTGSVLHHFGWNMDHTLRSGPLSPAMLHGPTPGSVGFSNFASLFDPASFRTGLTPSVTGNPSTGAPYAPPSPATQALFNMMTNGSDTPGTTGATSSSATLSHSLAGAAPATYRSERDLPNHFDIGFRNILDGKPAVDVASTAAASIPPLFATQPAPKPIGIVPPQPRPNARNALPFMAPNPTAFPGPGGAHNPLYLLTQAEQEIHDENDAIAADVLSNLNASYSMTSPEVDIDMPAVAPSPTALLPYANAIRYPSPTSATSSANTPAATQPVNTRKRKAANVPTVIDEEVAVPPPAQRGRRKGTGKKQKLAAAAAAATEEEMDMDDDVEARTGKPETEEEKRKSFLERNRQGSSCLLLLRLHSLKAQPL
jgi:ATF/CREB family transcription factor